MLAKLKSLIAHSLFVPVLCLSLVIALILFAGPYVAFAGTTPLLQWSTRIVVSLVLVLFFALYKTVQHIKTLQKQDKLVEEIAAKEDSAGEMISAESQALKEKFKEAFAALKTSKGNTKSLTEIPWYLIIGAPGSGKTTLLSNSGLQFPLAEKLDIKAVQGVGGTKNCDWWITQNAVLLDTAGRYSSQDSYQKVDESGWKNFLNLIKRYRKKPISGLIVSLSMTDLVSLNEYELNKHVSQLKQRIAEVNEIFSARFPIYLVITKSDLLAGFSQFFETYSHKEREQPFGFTFDQQTSLSGDVAKAFTTRYAELCDAISRRQWSRMSIERDDSKKSLLLLFREQLRAIQPSLHSAVEQLANNEDGAGTAIIRGVYFTSGTQSGAPLDRMVARVSQIFGLHPTHKPIWNNDQRSYFIRDLLEKVMFPEADRFGNLTHFERKKTRIKQVFVSAAGLAALGLCIGFFLSYQNNTEYLSTAEASLEQWHERFNSPVAGADEVSAIRHQLGALTAFSSNLNGLSEQQQAHFAGFGLNQAPAVQNALQASYGRLLTTTLMPYVQNQLEQMVANKTNLTTQYQALKTYLMLSDNEHRDNQYIARFLQLALNKQNTFSNTEYAQLIPHIENLVFSNARINSANRPLIASAREILSAQPLSEIYYQQFKSQLQSNQANGYLSMAQLAGSNWRSILTTSEDEIRTIDLFYTPDVFNLVFKQSLEQFIDSLALEAWVLGPQNVIDSERVSQAIEKLYVGDYINRWQTFLSSIQVNTLTDVAALNASLKVLTQTDSPLFLLLSAVSAATNLKSPEEQLLNQSKISDRVPNSLSTLAQRAAQTTPHFMVSSQFEKLHEAMTQERKQATESNLVTILQELNVALNFQQQQSAGQFETLSLKKLQGFGYLQTAPLDRWVAELANNISTVQNQQQKQQLSRQWANQILPTCRSIVETKYPFQSVSQVDANLVDLTQLFGKASSLANFFETHLAKLINQQSKPWQWQPGVQAKYQFNQDVLPFFERVAAIRNSLFSAKSTEPQLEFTLTPIYLDAKLARLNMAIYGTQLNYQFGRPTPRTVTWPPVNASGVSTIRFVRRDGSEIAISKAGLYGLARFMDDGDVKRVSGSKVQVTYSNADFSAMFEVTTASPTDPMLFNRLATFTCLTDL